MNTCYYLVNGPRRTQGKSNESKDRGCGFHDDCASSRETSSKSFERLRVLFDVVRSEHPVLPDELSCSRCARAGIGAGVMNRGTECEKRGGYATHATRFGRRVLHGARLLQTSPSPPLRAEGFPLTGKGMHRHTPAEFRQGESNQARRVWQNASY